MSHHAGGPTVGRMPEFLAETYAPRLAPGTAAPSAADAALAADQASCAGGTVRFLGAILVPDEETCFWLYEAPSADAVRAAMTRARLRPDRITPAVPIRPSDPALSPTAAPAAASSPDPDRPSCRPPRPRRSGDA
jgi:Protein of unknown function (DUF4242)